MEDKMICSLCAPEAGDAEAIRSYEEAFFQAGQSLQGFEGEEKRLREELKKIPNRTFLYKDQEGNIIGMGNLRLGLNAWLFEHVGHLGYSIHPDYQGRGYGRELVEAMMWVAALSGFDSLLVLCRRDNLASRKLLESLGAGLEEEGDICRYWLDTKYNEFSES